MTILYGWYVLNSCLMFINVCKKNSLVNMLSVKAFVCSVGMYHIFFTLSSPFYLLLVKILTAVNVSSFIFIKESNPWWKVALKKTLYVVSVEIIDKVDCCPRDIGKINITVSTSPTGLDPTCTQSMEYDGKTQNNKFFCSPPARGSYVTLTLIGDNVTLVLCHLEIKTIGELYLADS